MNQYLRMTLKRYLVVLLEKFDLNSSQHLNYFEFHLQLIHFHLVEVLENTKNRTYQKLSNLGPAKSSLNSIDIMILFTWVSEIKA